MELKPIRTEQDYHAALREASAFFNKEPEPGSPEGDRFEILSMLIEDYEQKHYFIDTPDPIEAIKFRMEQAGLTPKDLTPMIGKINRVYEILNYKRPLTLAMIRRLHLDLHIPAASLLKGGYERVKTHLRRGAQELRAGSLAIMARGSGNMEAGSRQVGLAKRNPTRPDPIPCQVTLTLT